jgi:ATP-dependent Clp protease ATP-binding subunit ClpB
VGFDRILTCPVLMHTDRAIVISNSRMEKTSANAFRQERRARMRPLLQESAMSVPGRVLDPTKRSPQLQEFEAALRSRIVGQDEAIEAVVAVYQVFCAGLNAPGRPIGNLLFLGPTGSGKTRIVEAAAEILFGEKKAVVKIDCAEFQHSHEIAKLIGSPPGYLGHRDTHPLITEESLSQYHTDRLKLSFLLFDEIEKASDALWQLLLGILDKATLTLGDTRRVDLSQTIIFLTSNLGAREITALVSRKMGFVEPSGESAEGLNLKLERTAVEAARRRFSPEFMNRLDRVVVFHQLRPEQLEEILDIELAIVQRQVLDGSRVPFMFRVMPEARAFLLREGTDLRYGARHLKRAIARQVVSPLANLLASGQVELGDMVCIDWNSETRCLVFQNEGPAPPVPAPQQPITTVAAAVSAPAREAVAGASAPSP